MPLPPISGQSSKSRIIGLPEVMERTNYSKSKIYRDMKTEKFPLQARKLDGSTSAGWFEDDIDEFLEGRRPESSRHGIHGLPEVARQGDVAVFGTHQTGRAKFNPEAVSRSQTRRIGEDQTLIRTGIKLNGADVFCHAPTRKLLVVVGSIEEEWLSALETTMGVDSNGGKGARLGNF
jgi:predicted DNA-binding transcriptional regulator AlpA